MHPGLRTTTQKGTRSVYQQDGSLLGVWQNQPPISLTENHSPQPPSSVICKALLLPASGVEWNLLFWRKCPLESKGNDIKGAGSESLWQFSLVFFNLWWYLVFPLNTCLVFFKTQLNIKYSPPKKKILIGFIIQTGTEIKRNVCYFSICFKPN